MRAFKYRITGERPIIMAIILLSIFCYLHQDTVWEKMEPSKFHLQRNWLIYEQEVERWTSHSLVSGNKKKRNQDAEGIESNQIESNQIYHSVNSLTTKRRTMAMNHDTYTVGGCPIVVFAIFAASLSELFCLSQQERDAKRMRGTHTFLCTEKSKSTEESKWQSFFDSLGERMMMISFPCLARRHRCNNAHSPTIPLQWYRCRCCDGG